MRRILSLIGLVLCFYNASAQSKPIEEAWVKQDSIFIHSIIQAYKKNPLNIESLFSKNNKQKDNLGFGYYSVSGGNGKGYVSFFYQLIYLGNKLISYKIDPQLPEDSRLLKRYLKFYSPLFKVNKNHKIEPGYYGLADMAKPLKKINNLNVLSPGLSYYMTPFSGTMYGDFSGWGSTLDNRAYYLLIKNKITPAICEVFLYSKNPATRFTAIEFYYQNIKRFTNRQSIEKRIEEIFKELPEIETMSADLVVPVYSREFVKDLARKK